MSWPPRRISPAVGATNPAIMRNVVVLPQPEGPSSTTSSPCPISRSTPATAWTSPYVLVRAVSCRRAIVSSLMLEHARQLDVAVRDQQARADQRDLQQRDGGDRRVDAPLQTLQDRDRERRLPRRDQEQGHLQIAERDDEAEQRCGDDSRLDDRKRDFHERSKRGGA